MGKRQFPRRNKRGIIFKCNKGCGKQEIQSRTCKDRESGLNNKKIIQYAADLQTQIFFRPSRSPVPCCWYDGGNS
jgi:hypothetical protein